VASTATGAITNPLRSSIAEDVDDTTPVGVAPNEDAIAPFADEIVLPVPPMLINVPVAFGGTAAGGFRPPSLDDEDDDEEDDDDEPLVSLSESEDESCFMSDGTCC